MEISNLSDNHINNSDYEEDQFAIDVLPFELPACPSWLIKEHDALTVAMFVAQLADKLVGSKAARVFLVDDAFGNQFGTERNKCLIM